MYSLRPSPRTNRVLRYFVHRHGNGGDRHEARLLQLLAATNRYPPGPGLILFTSGNIFDDTRLQRSKYSLQQHFRIEQ